MNDSSRQHFLSSSFDSASMKVDWISLSLKRSVSLPLTVRHSFIHSLETRQFTIDLIMTCPDSRLTNQ